MDDKYSEVRRISLRSVLQMLGYELTKFKRRSGKQEWYGSCIFHEAVKNKTSFSFTDEKWNCFSCGEHGAGAIDLVMKLRKVGFQEAVALLQPIQTSPLSVQKEVASDVGVSENAAFEGKYEKYYVPSDWLANRGISQKALDWYGVGQYCNPSRKSAYTNKVLFPIRRFSDGCKVGYLAREILDKDAPKYILPSGFHKHLEVWGSFEAKQLLPQGQARHRLGFVVESPLCVLKFYDLGFPSVSLFGAFASPEQVEILASLFQGIVYLPDRDKYPQVAPTVYSLGKRLWTKCPELPLGIDDPEKLNREQLAQLLKTVVS